MRVATFEHSGRVGWGVVEGDTVLDVAYWLAARGDPGAGSVRSFLQHGGTAQRLNDLVLAGKEAIHRLRLAEVRLLAPIPDPPKILCVGLNFEDYRKLLGLEYLAVPQVFLKSPSAVVGPDHPIEIPLGYGEVYHEFEVAAVIGKTSRTLSPETAWDAVFGYTIFDDIVLHDLELLTREYQQWAKNCDTFAPMGPWIVTRDEIDITNVTMVRRRNGQEQARSTTAAMHRPFNVLLAFVSTFMTLHPGDIVTSASPPAGPIAPGDVIEAEVEGIGVLRNPVVGRPVDASYARLLWGRSG
ncbi:MAG: fumarylacetoacetate hydrolase family protein [Bacillota bacterium]